MIVFFFKQKTAYEMRISDWSSDVCSSDLSAGERPEAAGRLVLLTTGGDRPYTEFAYRAADVLLLGRESAGVPAEVHAAADARLVIPLLPGRHSLNVAQAGAMALGEALRQTGGFPGSSSAARDRKSTRLNSSN